MVGGFIISAKYCKLNLLYNIIYKIYTKPYESLYKIIKLYLFYSALGLKEIS